VKIFKSASFVLVSVLILDFLMELGVTRFGEVRGCCGMAKPLHNTPISLVQLRKSYLGLTYSNNHKIVEGAGARKYTVTVRDHDTQSSSEYPKSTQ
jgi:hypothetical protein